MGKNVELFKSYTRHSQIPIDATSLFGTYADALDYAKNNGAAYPGQIISIDNKLTNSVAIYKVDYDSDNKHLTLTEINGISSGSGGFDIKGAVDYYEELPPIADSEDPLIAKQPKNGDLWFVRNPTPGGFYMWYDGAFNAISLNDVVYASETSDGIITRKTYKSLINKNGYPSVYFNSSKTGSSINPENNSWIRLQTDGVEDVTGLNSISIPTTNKVIRMIKGELDTDPKLYILPNNQEKTNKSGTNIQPSFKVVYYPNIAGEIRQIDIYKDGELLEEKYVGAEIHHDLDEKNNIYYWFIYNAQAMLSPNTHGSKFEFAVNIRYSGNSNMDDGDINASIVYSFCDPIYVYLNEIETPTLNSDNIISISISKEDNIHIVGFEIPENYEIISIEYDRQPSIDFSSLFVETTPHKANMLKYMFDVDTANEGISFTNDCTFTIHIREKESE